MIKVNALIWCSNKDSNRFDLEEEGRDAEVSEERCRRSAC